MSNTFGVSNQFLGFREQMAKFKEFPNLLRKHLRQTMVEVTRDAKGRVDAQASEHIVTGRYKGSIKSTVSASRTVLGSVTGRVKSTYHGRLVEEGRKPGKMPNIAATINMVPAAGTMEEQMRQAYALALSIARKGTRGFHIFKNAFDAVKGSVPSKFLAALGRVTAELQNGR